MAGVGEGGGGEGRAGGERHKVLCRSIAHIHTPFELTQQQLHYLKLCPKVHVALCNGTGDE